MSCVSSFGNWESSTVINTLQLSLLEVFDQINVMIITEM